MKAIIRALLATAGTLGISLALDITPAVAIALSVGVALPVAFAYR